MSDCTYRGIFGKHDGVKRIFVYEGNPSWRDVQGSASLSRRELMEPDSIDDGLDHIHQWGYCGGSPYTTSRAILNDIFGMDPPEALEDAFCEEVIAQLADDDWMLSRRTIINWAVGWRAAQKTAEVSRG